MTSVVRLLDQSSSSLRARLIAIFGMLAVLNLGTWLWALAAFRERPLLLGIALVVYGLGLRHAVDADHIAAIDNVTRKLMQERQRPVAVGFFFAMGHSAVVIVVTALVAHAASGLEKFQSLQAVGGTITTLVSILFLTAVAVMNIVIFRSIHQAYRRVRNGGPYVAEDLDLLLGNRGILSRLLRPLFRMVSQSWHLFPIGVLFGLGFDTATEVAMFGISATQIAKGLSYGAVLVFPCLFAAAMSLVDTIDSVLMLGAYEWAFVKPIRKLYYNMTITLISIVIALLIGGIEALGLLGGQLNLSGRFWQAMSTLNDNINSIGIAVIGLFFAAWMLSFLIYRLKGLDCEADRGTG